MANAQTDGACRKYSSEKFAEYFQAINNPNDTFYQADEDILYFNEVIIFRKGDRLPNNSRFTHNDEDLEIVNRFSYLGAVFISGGGGRCLALKRK